MRPTTPPLGTSPWRQISSPPAVETNAPTQRLVRVTGNFTGTTDEILQWAACKWGIDEDLVRAQAAIESWWRQDTKGDWGTDPSRCPPGHGLGIDGRPSPVPRKLGAAPDLATPMNSPPGRESPIPALSTPTPLMPICACYEGYEWWLNDVERGNSTVPAMWGCIGRWFSGRWHTQAAEGYIDRVKGYLDDRIWETPDFQEP